jgi:hypothetical protein
MHFNEILATLYGQLGVATDRTLPDASGRPVAVLDSGQLIRELV